MSIRGLVYSRRNQRTEDSLCLRVCATSRREAISTREWLGQVRGGADKVRSHSTSVAIRVRAADRTSSRADSAILAVTTDIATNHTWRRLPSHSLIARTRTPGCISFKLALASSETRVWPFTSSCESPASRAPVVVASVACALPPPASLGSSGFARSRTENACATRERLRRCPRERRAEEWGSAHRTSERATKPRTPSRGSSTRRMKKRTAPSRRR